MSSTYVIKRTVTYKDGMTDHSYIMRIGTLFGLPIVELTGNVKNAVQYKTKREAHATILAAQRSKSEIYTIEPFSGEEKI